MNLDNWGAGGNVYQGGQQFDFILQPAEIFDALKQSKDNETSIGIYSPILGPTMFITGVEDLVDADSDVVVVLKKYDMSGKMLERYVVRLSEIVSVCPFTSPIKNPFLENLNKDTDWFSIINSNEDPSNLHKDLQ